MTDQTFTFSLTYSEETADYPAEFYIFPVGLVPSEITQTVGACLFEPQDLPDGITETYDVQPILALVNAVMTQMNRRYPPLEQIIWDTTGETIRCLYVGRDGESYRLVDGQAELL